MKNKIPQLTEEEKAAGITIEVPLSELEVVDVSDKNIENRARGFIMGTQAIGRRKEVRELLEEKVIKKIGHKGKYLTDKLFELIEGVFVIDKSKGREIRYYKVPPQLNAIIYALDRVLGKPTQHTEHTEEKKGILLVEHIIRNLAGEKNYGENGVGKNSERGGIIGSGAGSGSAINSIDIRVSEESVSK